MSWLKYTLLFLFFFALGFSTRVLLFSYYQLPAGKEYFQELPLMQDQGGSETPELAWQNYLNALRNGDIETALKQVWPYERERVREVFERFEEVDYLSEFVDSIREKGLKKINNGNFEVVIDTVITDKVQYAYSGNWNLIIKEWNGPTESIYKIKLNPKNKRWYVSPPFGY